MLYKVADVVDSDELFLCPPPGFKAPKGVSQPISPKRPSIRVWIGKHSESFVGCGLDSRLSVGGFRSWVEED